MTETEYRKIQAVRNSGLGLVMQKSPAHYLHDLRKPETTTEATSFGSYVHALILTPEICDKEYFVIDEALRPQPLKNYTDASNRAWKAQAESYCKVHGLALVTMDDHKRAIACRDAITRHGLANEMVNSSVGVHERLVQWTNKETGVLCKARIDRTRNQGKIVDLKTSKDASARAFIRSIMDYGYHRQGAFYMDGSLGKKFSFIVVESQPPHGVQVYDLSEEFLELGRASYQGALKHIKICRDKYGSEFDETTVWPAYDYFYELGEVLSPPAWAQKHDFNES